MVDERIQDDQLDVMEQQGDRSEQAVADDVGLIDTEGGDNDADSDDAEEEDDADEPVLP